MCHVFLTGTNGYSFKISYIIIYIKIYIKKWNEKLRKKNVDHDNCGNNTKQKWYTFTCIRKETIFITKLIQHTNLKIALKANTT